MTTTTPIQPPPLNVQSYYIEELAFRAFDEYDKGQDSSGALDVDFDVERDETKMRDFRIIMRVSLAAGEYTREQNSPYSISLRIVGYFTFSEGTDESVMQRMARINGSSILYGIARGIVGQATGASIHGQFVLPAVNLVEIVKTKDALASADEQPEPQTAAAHDTDPVRQEP